MNHGNRHKGKGNQADPQSAIFVGGVFHWKKPSDQVWAELAEKMQQTPPVPRRRLVFRPFVYAVAAVALVLLSLGFFARNYSRTIDTKAGEHFTAMLPDGSSVLLNAETSMRYLPYWWRFERKLWFNGEGFFEVKKGKKFSVVSELGETVVLGTSFNIFARENIYKVTCITGSVKVISPKNQSLVLFPNTKAEIDENGTIKLIEQAEPTIETGWKNQLFFFTAAPLAEVFREIERQYGIRLKNTAVPVGLYTGNFRKENKVEDVLKVVCLPMGLDYKKLSDKEFLIFQNN